MRNSFIYKLAKSNTFLKISFYFYHAISKQLHYNIAAFIKSLTWFFKDYIKFKLINSNGLAPLKVRNLLPRLSDKTSSTPLDHIYILQNAWACEKIFNNSPKSHVDIGSSIGAVAIISQFVPTTMVDIRSVDIKLKDLNFTKGTILKLPFKKGSIESLSSICVVEHIGLGRYGDPIDPYGTEKSLKEIQRVVRGGGSILLSVPVGTENRVLFNAHREFVPNDFIKLMNRCELVEKRFIVKNQIKKTFKKTDDSVVGLFQFIKNI